MHYDPIESVSGLWERQDKDQSPTRKELMAKYEKDYARQADRMIEHMLEHYPMR